MKKVNVLIFSLAILFLMSCGGAGESLSKDEKTAARFCTCGAELTEDIEKAKADPASIDQDAFMKKMETFEKCIDPDGSLQKEEAAMTSEEKKANGEKINALVSEKCPEVAKAFEMDKR